MTVQRTESERRELLETQADRCSRTGCEQDDDEVEVSTGWSDEIASEEKGGYGVNVLKREERVCEQFLFALSSLSLFLFLFLSLATNLTETKPASHDDPNISSLHLLALKV